MVKMNAVERLTAMMLLPQEGSFVTLRIQRELTAKLGMNDEEYKEFGIEQIGQSVRFGVVKPKDDTEESKKEAELKSAEAIKKAFEEREIKLGEKQTDMIKDALVKMDKENKLEQRHFTLYEKFCEEKKE